MFENNYNGKNSDVKDFFKNILAGIIIGHIIAIYIILSMPREVKAFDGVSVDCIKVYHATQDSCIETPVTDGKPVAVLEGESVKVISRYCKDLTYSIFGKKANADYVAVFSSDGVDVATLATCSDGRAYIQNEGYVSCNGLHDVFDALQEFPGLSE